MTVVIDDSTKKVYDLIAGYSGVFFGVFCTVFYSNFILTVVFYCKNP